MQQQNEEYKKLEELIKHQASEDEFLELFKRVVRKNGQLLFEKPKYALIGSEYECYHIRLYYCNDKAPLRLIICPQSSEIVVSEKSKKKKKAL